jgi:chloramphenicol 3-O phosphotransferase
MRPGRIVVLNGAPRSGKSSIAAAIQANVSGNWMNLGVDALMRSTPAHLLPGIGLRPGGERPDLEPLVASLYSALYDAMAAFSRQAIDVVADLGHHDGYSRSLGILPDCARRLTGLPAYFVGVYCPIDVIMARRRQSPPGYEAGPGVPEPVRRWQDAVHVPGIYDLKIDSSLVSPEEAARQVEALVAQSTGPSAFTQLAVMEAPVLKSDPPPHI